MSMSKLILALNLQINTNIYDIYVIFTFYLLGMNYTKMYVQYRMIISISTTIMFTTLLVTLCTIGICESPLLIGSFHYGCHLVANYTFCKYSSPYNLFWKSMLPFKIGNVVLGLQSLSLVTKNHASTLLNSAFSSNKSQLAWCQDNLLAHLHLHMLILCSINTTRLKMTILVRKNFDRTAYGITSNCKIICLQKCLLIFFSTQSIINIIKNTLR